MATDPTPTHEVTNLLQRLNDGTSESRRQTEEQLFRLVYDELHRIAAAHMARERPGHALQATVLVDDAFLAVARGKAVRLQDRAQFYRLAATAMRQVLVSYARREKAEKRGGGAPRLNVEDVANLAAKGRSLDLVALDEALTRLGAIEPQQEQIVSLRYFGGRTIEETAEFLQLSVVTVNREWKRARTWLKWTIGKGDDSHDD